MAETASRQVSFSVSPGDEALISAIVDRVVGIYYQRGLGVDKITLRMDITACHANGCPLDLTGLLSASESDLDHDLGGINRHIDHETGTLTGCFVPRFALPEGGM